MRVLQVAPTDRGGGAEGVALLLHAAFRERGIDAWLGVGRQRTVRAGVREIPREGLAGRLSLSLERRGALRLGRLARALAEPGTLLDLARGHEDFRFPGLDGLVARLPGEPDLVHLHNLHGGYFDLRVLSDLTRRYPVVATLHDAWTMTGHCAQPFDCDGWLRGCGRCPYLRTYPGLRRDGTAFNLERKRDLYLRSSLVVVTPSAWLQRMVERSVLSPAVARGEIIPNGIDLDVFRPGDRRAARLRLGLDEDTPTLLFAAQGGRANEFKDYPTLRTAIGILAAGRTSRLELVVLGEGPAEIERLGPVAIRALPAADSSEVAAWLQAADAYVHPSRADTFPLGILEALACGRPVVASRVGGIPEQLRPLGASDRPSGVLVEPSDAPALAAAIGRLLDDPALRTALGRQAAEDARERFGAGAMVDAYLRLYRDVLAQDCGPGQLPPRPSSHG